MKKIIGLLLTGAMICSMAACSAQDSGSKDSDSTPDTTAVETTIAESTTKAELSADMKETIKSHKFEGVIYAVKDGAPLVSYAEGTLEDGEKITIDSPMPIGSVSKQFCAAAVMRLQEQGKLSVNDKLDKYYPDYKEGSRITLYNLLSMRSGIPEITEESGAKVTVENTEEQNTAAIKQWVFAQKLDFELGSSFAYANINYFLLSDIVSQVSGKAYIDYIRESFLTPLGMTHTGSIGELGGNPSWSQGHVYQQVDLQPGLTNGCGDIISNAADMTVWLNSLSNGKAVSAESFKAMTTDYSSGEGYGYGMYTDIEGGVGHYGAIGSYSAFDYINTDDGITLFTASNTIDPLDMTGFAGDLLTDLSELV